jgi:hypothetical protein
MRLRGHYKNYQKSRVGENKDDETQMREGELSEKMQKTKKVEDEQQAGGPKFAKEAKPVKPFKMIRELIENPNFNMQLMVILLSLTSDNIRMDRRIDGMTTTIDKVRNITELVNDGVKSMKMVSEVPKSIRRLLE